MEPIETYKIGDKIYFDYMMPFTGIVEETGTLYKFTKIGDKCIIKIKSYLKMSVAEAVPAVTFYSVQGMSEDFDNVDLGKVYDNHTVYLLEKDLDKVKEIFKEYYQAKIEEYNEKINGLKQKQEELNTMTELIK